MAAVKNLTISATLSIFNRREYRFSCRGGEYNHSESKRYMFSSLSLKSFLWAFLAFSVIITPAGAYAAAPQPVVRQIHVLSGYPAGGEMPLLAVVTAPQGFLLSGEVRLRTSGGEGLEPINYTAKPRAESKGSGPTATLTPKLRVSSEAKPGKRTIKGLVAYTMTGKDGVSQKGEIPFTAEVEVFPVGAIPKRLAPPAMMQAMGVMMRMPVRPAAAPAAKADQTEDPFADRSLALVLLLVFLGGLALNLTPCVYPMIPITVSYFGGRAGGSKGSLVAGAAAYLLGMCISYSILGSLAALGGGFLGEVLAHPAVLGAIALILVIMAASMFGLWEIKMPTALNRISSANRSGLLGTLLMGLTVGIIVAPCVGPFVVALLAHVGEVGVVWYGLVVFLALSLGLGLPLAVLAVFSGAITRLPGAGDWMLWVRKFFGVVLLLMALYILEPVMGPRVFFWAFGLLALTGGIYLGVMEKSGSGSFNIVKRVMSVVLLAAVGAFLWTSVLPRTGWSFYKGGPSVGSIAWEKYTPAVMDKALKAGKPVLVYFTADWCGPCKKLKATTLKDPRVVELAKAFTPIMVNLTASPTAADKALMRRYGVRGVPTNVIISAKGKWLMPLTMIGYRDAEQFSARLKAALAMKDK